MWFITLEIGEQMCLGISLVISPRKTVYQTNANDHCQQA